MNHIVAAFTEVGSGTCFIFTIRASFGAHNTQIWCFYADNTQLYLPVKATDPGKLSALLDCITAVKNWMTENFLQVNSTKTEVLVIGSQQMAKQAGRSYRVFFTQGVHRGSDININIKMAAIELLLDFELEVVV